MFELFTGHSGLNPDDIAESLDILKDQRVGPGVRNCRKLICNFG